jgi:hypothetical protein
MYRQRRKKLHKRRRAALVVASAAVLALAIAIPTLASASGVSNLLGQAGAGSGGASGGSGGSAGTTNVDPKAGVPPTYTPPLHGTNPHGQGTDAVVDIQPSSTNPYAGDPTSNPPGTGEEVIVGDSRGEQGASGYNGKVTLLYLFGSPVVQVTSNPGETKEGPLDPIQTQLLDAICTNSNGQACITLLKMHSATTGSGSENAFELLGVHLGGAQGLNADVLQSDGNISDDGTCQTSQGDSNVAKVSAGGNPVLDALQGNSTSQACSGGASSTQQDSTVLKLGGNGLPIPASGCDNGTPNTNFVSLAPLLATVCNAEDVNGSQTSAPYGVREALAAFALISGDSSLLKVTGSANESHAVAPGGTTPGTPGGNGGTAGAGGKGGNGNGGNGGNAGANGGGAGAGNGGAANQAAAGNGSLAFTGADLFVLGLVGGALILGGLALTTMAGRSHRRTV